MAINFRSNTVIKNLRVGPLSGGGNGGGGGGSSEPSYLAVGAPERNSHAGAAYIYDTSNYSATPIKLEPSGLAGGDSFGYSVAATSDYIIVGAYQDSTLGTSTGAAYVYDATNLSSTPTKLTPTGLDTLDRFGNSVACINNLIFIGAYLDDDQGSNAGAVYVYDATNLSATPTKLAPSILNASGQFGWSVAATSNQVIVGAGQDSDKGAVYVLDATNLSATPTKLAPSGLDNYDSFGYSVAATSDLIVVGAIADADQGSQAGAVYVYDATNLSATPTKLTPSGLGAGDKFGISVAATANQIVVGVRQDDDQGTNAGAAYVYDATNLSATPTKLTPSGLGDYDIFGSAVAAAGNHIVIGALNDDDNGSNAGAVYIYDATNLSATPTKLLGESMDNTFGASVSLG